MNKLEHLERVIREYGPYTEKELLELNLYVALEYSRGFMSRASRTIGLSEDAVRKRVLLSQRLKDLVDDYKQRRRSNNADTRRTIPAR